MVPSCSICTHPSSTEINEAILRGDANRRIASLHGVTEAAVRRHKRHLPADIAKARRAAEVASADKLLNRVQAAEGRAERLYSAAEQILQRALEEDSPRNALAAIKVATGIMAEARQYLELRGELTGELGAARGGSSEPGNRPNVTIVFPTLSAEDLKAIENAKVIDLPTAQRRLLTRPSDGKPL
jgi:hypothetical protein